MSKLSLVSNIPTKQEAVKSISEFTPQSKLEAAKFLLWKSLPTSVEGKKAVTRCYEFLQKNSDGGSFQIEGLTVTPSYTKVETVTIQKNKHSEKLQKQIAKKTAKLEAKKKACTDSLKADAAEIAALEAVLEQYVTREAGVGELRSYSVK